VTAGVGAFIPGAGSCVIEPVKPGTFNLANGPTGVQFGHVPTDESRGLASSGATMVYELGTTAGKKEEKKANGGPGLNAMVNSMRLISGGVNVPS